MRYRRVFWICSIGGNVDIPDDLVARHFDALNRIPALEASAAGKQWSASFTACVVSATAAAKGQHALAEALLEMTSPEAIREFLEWSYDR